MRIGVLLVSLALLAAPAVVSRAASEAPKTKPAATPKLPTNLRGSIAAASARTAVLPQVAPPGLTPKPPAAPLASPIANAAASDRQCRTDCAHAYYFCQSGPAANDCADSWSQCLSACSFPPLSIRR